MLTLTSVVRNMFEFKHFGCKLDHITVVALIRRLVEVVEVVVVAFAVTELKFNTLLFLFFLTELK